MKFCCGPKVRGFGRIQITFFQTGLNDCVFNCRWNIAHLWELVEIKKDYKNMGRQERLYERWREDMEECEISSENWKGR